MNIIKVIDHRKSAKNVDFELNKKKVFLDTTDGQRVNKENNHLDFLPPVMTIIDVTKNKEEKRFSSRNQDIKEKDCSKYLFNVNGTILFPIIIQSIFFLPQF